VDAADDELADQGNTVAVGEPEIYERQIRAGALVLRQRCSRVRRLANHLEVRLRRQHRAHPGSERLLVIDE
jgi:hypothetical protein